MPRRSSRPRHRTAVLIAALEPRRLFALAPIDAATDGGTGNLGARDVTLSADGRYATFLSASTDLVASPTTSYAQIFRRDLVNGTTRLVSLAAGDDAEANDDAVAADLSADGRVVAFETTANDLIGDDVDANGVSDVYVRDMQTGRVTLITRNRTSAVGGELVDLSADGQRVLFRSGTDGSNFVRGLVDQNNADDLFVFDRRTGRFACVTMNGNGDRTANRGTTASTAAGEASLSGDGRHVLFPSRASDLVADARDGNTFGIDLFIHDLATRTTEYVSARQGDAARGANEPSGYGEVTDDGRYVIFRSTATNLVVGVSDENDVSDIFVRDRQTDTTRLLSINADGTEAGNAESNLPDITPDGRFAVFSSAASDLVRADGNTFGDVFLFDLTEPRPRASLVNVNARGTGGGNADSIEARISDDAALVVFASRADDLPADLDKQDTDFAAIYSHDRATGRNTIITGDLGGEPADADSGAIVISADATRIAYLSESANLVRSDTNNEVDAFVALTPGRSVSELDATGRLTIRGSPVSDQVNVQRVNTKIVVRRNDERFEYDAAEVKFIDVLAGDGDDAVTLGTNLSPGAYVFAGDGDDRVNGSGGNDSLIGGTGRDTLRGGDGDDRLDGGKGNDTLYGEADDDCLYGDDSNDLLEGGGGRNRLFGGIGRDVLVGGGSNDRFYAADGFADRLIGNAGTDTAVDSDDEDILDSVNA